MTNEELRLECLRLAIEQNAGLKTGLVLKQAEAYADFVLEGKITPDELSS